MKAKVTVNKQLERRVEVNITLPSGQNISVSIQDDSDSIMVHAEDIGNSLSLVPSAGNCIFIKSVNK